MSRSALEALRTARAAAREQLTGLPQVVGTALGYRRTAGRRSRTPAIVAYVQTKLPLAALPPAACVPRTVTVDRQSVEVDVCALGSLCRQIGSGPWFSRDAAFHQGTITALGRSDDGQNAFALTCAHCLWGLDQDVDSPEPVGIWDAAAAAYVPVGNSAFGVDLPGLGQPGAFGFSDWGLVDLADPVLADRARLAPELTCRPPLRTARVHAQSAHGPLTGWVEHVEAEIWGALVDVVILVNGSGTLKGDSGMLWRDAQGRGLAMHAQGLEGPGYSRYSFCMAAARVAAQLQLAGVQLVDA